MGQQKKSILSIIGIIVCLLTFISCSTKSHYFLSTGKYCNEELYNTRFTAFKGVKVDTLKSHSDIVLNESATITLNGIRLDSYLNNTDSDSTSIYKLNAIYQLKTSNKTYLLLYFQDLEYSIRDIYLPLLISINDNNHYFFEESSNHDLKMFGDFNRDGNLDFALINDTLNIMEFYTVSDDKIKKEDSVFLSLKEIRKPYKNDKLFKVKKYQENSGWWGNSFLMLEPK